MYALNWITDHLATGHAPMSYDELDAIREQGITAIVNLCGEFCDLHQVEESTGFEVYYLPVVDECSPDLAAMEKALDWLDEALYLNKKVLVHCRLGHGRTGTFIAAYLLRRGFDFKMAEETMKGRNANPATYEQRSFLKKYGKQVGPLRTATPSIDNRPAMGIAAQQLGIYDDLLTRFDSQFRVDEQVNCCGRANNACCRQPFDLLLIESIHLSQAINKTLNQEQRQKVIERAFILANQLKTLHHNHPGVAIDAVAAITQEPLTCPLLDLGECLVLADRPPRCRYWGVVSTDEHNLEISQAIAELSQQTFLALTGRVAPVENLRFSSADTISGKFVQLYFQAMTRERG